MELKKYTVVEWEEVTGQEAEENEVAFYAIEDDGEPVGVYAASEMADGTFTVYGLCREMKNLDYDQMVEILYSGIEEE